MMEQLTISIKGLGYPVKFQGHFLVETRLQNNQFVKMLLMKEDVQDCFFEAMNERTPVIINKVKHEIYKLGEVNDNKFWVYLKEMK